MIQNDLFKRSSLAVLAGGFGFAGWEMILRKSTINLLTGINTPTAIILTTIFFLAGGILFSYSMRK